MEAAPNQIEAEGSRKSTRVICGMILDIEDYNKHVQSKNLGVKIINSLESSGLLNFCSFKYDGFYKNEVIDFYKHAYVENGFIKSIVGGVELSIGLGDIRTKYNLLEKGLRVENHGFDLNAFWSEIRHDAAPVGTCNHGNKVLLKHEYGMLLDIVHKIIECKYASRNYFTKEKLGLMHIILNNVAVDWGVFVFGRMIEQVGSAKPLVNGWFPNDLGYGFVVGELLKTKGVALSKPRPIQNQNYIFRTPTLAEPIQKATRKRKPANPPNISLTKKSLVIREPSLGESNTLGRASDDACSHPFVTLPAPIVNSLNPNEDEVGVLSKIGSVDDIPTYGADSVLLEELNRVKFWRSWRLSDHHSVATSIGPNTLELEEFALAWLGTRNLAIATRLSVINECFMRKLANSRGKEVARDSTDVAVETVDGFARDDIARAMTISREEAHGPPGEASILKETNGGSLNELDAFPSNFGGDNLSFDALSPHTATEVTKSMYEGSLNSNQVTLNLSNPTSLVNEEMIGGMNVRETRMNAQEEVTQVVPSTPLLLCYAEPVDPTIAEPLQLENTPHVDASEPVDSTLPRPQPTAHTEVHSHPIDVEALRQNIVGDVRRELQEMKGDVSQEFEKVHHRIGNVDIKLDDFHKGVYERAESLLLGQGSLKGDMAMMTNKQEEHNREVLKMFLDLGKKGTDCESRLRLVENQLKALLHQTGVNNNLLVGVQKSQLGASASFQSYVAAAEKGERARGAPSHLVNHLIGPSSQRPIVELIRPTTSRETLRGSSPMPSQGRGRGGKLMQYFTASQGGSSHQGEASSRQGGPSPQECPRSSPSRSIYDETKMKMVRELETFFRHSSNEMVDGRSFEECVAWYQAGVLRGDNIQEAYGNYVTEQVTAPYQIKEGENDFKKLRAHVNALIGKR